MLECHWKSTLGIECLGCGFQRSLDLLFHGQIVESIQLFPATIPILTTFAYAGLHLWLKFDKGARNIVILFSSSATIMLARFIYAHF